jgi:hypothetical protein
MTCLERQCCECGAMIIRRPREIPSPFATRSPCTQSCAVRLQCRIRREFGTANHYAGCISNEEIDRRAEIILARMNL